MKKRKTNGKGFIVDLRLKEVDFKPILKLNNAYFPTLDDLFEFLKKKVG